MTWTRRHILSLADFTPAEYDTVLQTANSFQGVLARGAVKKVPTLQGRVVANLFFESSTRTRSSFELAAKRLSADTLNFAAATSSLTKGETILDTAKTYLAMGADLMVIRHKQAGVPHAIATELDTMGIKVGILNAGDGQHEHPSQALLDLLTICETIDPSNPRLCFLAIAIVAFEQLHPSFLPVQAIKSSVYVFPIDDLPSFIHERFRAIFRHGKSRTGSNWQQCSKHGSSKHRSPQN